MKVICISGKARHGKDTLANLLSAKLRGRGYRVLTTHYGDLVKYICKMFFDWDGEKDEYGRYIMQYVGTDLVRQKHPTFWVDFVMNVLSMFHDKWDFVIIPDCRFPNELTCVSDAGFPMIHIRIKRTGFETPLTKTQQAHPSETSLDNVVPDKLVYNDGTLEDLYDKADTLIDELLSDMESKA
jgi:hypothetical protein